MRKWLRGFRGAIGMGVIWAAGGAGVGMFIELLANILPGGFAPASAVDIWPIVLAVIGFLGGAVFSAVLGLAARGHRFEELSLPAFAVWGAVAGVVLGGIVVALGAPGVIIAATALTSALAASASLLLARMAEQRSLPHAHAEMAEIKLAEGAGRRQLEDRGGASRG